MVGLCPERLYDFTVTIVTLFCFALVYVWLAASLIVDWHILSFVFDHFYLTFFHYFYCNTIPSIGFYRVHTSDKKVYILTIKKKGKNVSIDVRHQKKCQE